MMRKVLIITNYNYENFLNDCFLSIKNQTSKFDKIIFIDDGSTDESVKLVKKYFLNNNDIYIKEKTNGGQLSCFNSVVNEILPNDIVYLIDSDDVYANDYVELISPCFEKNNVDLVFTTPIEFKDGKNHLVSAKLFKDKFFTFSSTSAITRMTQCWIGAPTSCIVLKGSLYLTIFPYPYESEWRTRADDVIVYGSSILGAKKMYLEYVGVGYRIHGNNNFANKKISRDETVWRTFYLDRLFNWFSRKANVVPKASLRSALAELSVIPKIYRKKFFIPNLFGLFKNRILS